MCVFRECVCPVSVVGTCVTTDRLTDWVGARGVSDLRWLELSNTRITDTGVGKLVAIIEDGSPYGSGEVAGHSHSSRTPTVPEPTPYPHST